MNINLPVVRLYILRRAVQIPHLAFILLLLLPFLLQTAFILFSSSPILENAYIVW